MKKIGIITFHRAMNFGAMLQAFALQTVLEEKADAVIIDYRSKSIEDFYYQKGMHYNCLMIIRFFFLRPLYKFITEKKYNFSCFEKKYLKTTRKKYNRKSIKNLNKYFDIFVSGSDQVWNPGCIKDDLNYLLEFADHDKRYSYAASFGNGNFIFTDQKREKYRELIGNIHYPLLRETRGVEILKSLNTINCEKSKVVCDPVFLLDKKQWISLLDLKEEKADAYILLFIVTPPKNAEQFAFNLKEETGYEVRYINTYGEFDSCPSWCMNYMTVGPRRFLELLMNATYIVTTSFHGMALSMVFGKRFFYELDYRDENNNDRIECLARQFNVEDRKIKTSKIPSLLKLEENTNLEQEIRKYAEQSKQILFETLNLL